MSEKKIAILFPGQGYGKDKPLLYYARKLFLSKGYEVINLEYHDLPPAGKGDPEAGSRMAHVAYAQLEEQLKDTDLRSYDKVVLCGKSLGSILCTIFEMYNKLGAKEIWFTPVEQNFEYGGKGALAFIGNADPWSRFDKIKELADKKGTDLIVYEGCDHSLECGNVDKDIETLRDVMRRVEEFIE